MKILLTSTGSWGTGSFTAIDAMIDELARLGHEVKVFFPEAPDVNRDHHHSDRPFSCYEIWQFPIEHNGVSLPTYPLIIPDPHPRNPNPITFKSLTPKQLNLYFDEFERRISQVIADFQPDIIESNHIWAMGYVLSRMGVAYICTAHNSDQMAYEYDARMQPYAQQAAEHAQFIFSISAMLSEKITNLYGIDASKIALIPNGFDRNLFKKQTVDRQAILKTLNLNIPDNATIINLTGKISRTKGVDILLLANKWLQQRGNIHVLILGTGDVDAVLDEDKKDDYCFKNVHFLGHQPAARVAQLHNISRLSVVPSRSEGFPISAMEAMGCALPVVMTQLGGLEKHIVGRVVAQEHPAELAAAIIEVIDLSTDEYHKLSARALAEVSQYTWEHNVATRLEYYHKALSLAL